MLECNFTSKQNFSEERLNFEKLIWFYLLKLFFLSTIIFVPNFAAFNYQKVIADIWIIFFSYSFCIDLPLFWSLDPCPPKILGARLGGFLSSQVIVSCRVKVDNMFFTVFLKKSTFSFTLRFKQAVPQLKHWSHA